MGRSAPSTGARRARFHVRGRISGRCALLSLLFVGCSPEFEKLEQQRSARGTLGEEVYKSLCRRVAGTEMPDDLEGRGSEVICLGDEKAVADELEERRADLPKRVVTLAERRAQFVRAVDDMLPDPLGDELELLMRELLPFYDPPDERIQQNTRAFAGLLQKMAADDAALDGLTRVARDGVLSREGSFGLYRALLGYDRLNGLFSKLLPMLADDPNVRPYFQTMLTGMALELSTSELDDAPDSDTRRLKSLLARTDPDFATERPLFITLRDERGFPIPTPSAGQNVPFPFVDRDGDNLADVRDGEFELNEAFRGALPGSFATPSERGVVRDEMGRALGFRPDGTLETERTLFQTRDVDGTLLAGALREIAQLFDAQGQTAVHVARLVPALFGDRNVQQRIYGKAALNYPASDTDQSPVVNLIHASMSMIDHPLYEESLELTQKLLASHEPELVHALSPLLELEKRTRAANDAYPAAELADQSTFWDELLFEAERMSRRRKTQDGPTLVELLLRGALGYARNVDKPGAPVEQMLSPDVLRHQGALVAALMRYKDEWRNNPKGESEREPGDPATIGSFRTPVDRSLPDAPVTCGKDGCGGLVKDSPFERWAKPEQNCVLQRDGRPKSSKECGAPANQSILHRSMGLIWEMAGRSQCNKPITLGDLLDFAVLDDPCQVLATEKTCSADAECAATFGHADYVCDARTDKCVAQAGSATCIRLRQEQRTERNDTIVQAEERVAEDYECPTNKPDAACHAFSDKYPAAFVDPDGPGVGVPATLPECNLLDLPDVGRSFGRALTHEFTIEIPNPWMRRYLEDVARAGDPSIPDCADAFDITDPYEVPPCIPGSARLSRDVYEDMPAEIDTLGELIEYLLDDSSLFNNDKDLAELRPDVAALTRVLFAPPGSTSFIMFDPLLVHGAPKACTEATKANACLMDDTAPTPEGGCCIFDLKNPPFRYRLDTYYGTTSFAWEHRLEFNDGSSLSLLDAMKTLADGVNRTDYDAASGDDPKNFEGTDFLFSTLGKVVAQHYDSPRNPAVQNKDKSAPHYRSKSNLVSYEELLADALDDGTLVREQLAPHGGNLFDDATLPKKPERQLGLIYHSYPLLQKLVDLDIGGRDGVSFSASLAELLLSPHASCAPAGADLRVIDGKGACDMLASQAPSCDGKAPRAPGYKAPLAYRDGRSTVCWNDGTCFDRAGACHYASPLYLALDAIGAVDDRIGDSEPLEAAFQGARAGLFDGYFKLGKDRFLDRRLRALLLAMLDDAREKWAKDRASGRLSQVGPELVADTVDLLQNPVFAGALGVIEQLSLDAEVMEILNRYARGVLGGEQSEAQARALIATFADMFELLPGDDALLSLFQVMGNSILPDVSGVLSEGAPFALNEGMIWRNLELLRDTAKMDREGVLGRLLNNAVALPGFGTQDERPSPLAEIYDVLIALEREDPSATSTLSAQDFRAVFGHMAEVLLDKRRGFERLYEIVQCRNGSTETFSCE